MTPSPPSCKLCGSERTSRTERKGFLQKVVLLKLGLFPWECNTCWKVFLSSERGKRTGRRRSRPEGSLPETNNSPLESNNA